MSDLNYYQVLDVSRKASQDEIQEAYRALVRLFHPDHYPAGSPEQDLASEKLMKINEAYETLRQPAARARYDRTLAYDWTPFLKSPPPPPPPPRSKVWALVIVLECGRAGIFTIAAIVCGRRSDEFAAMTIPLAVVALVSYGYAAYLWSKRPR